MSGHWEVLGLAPTGDVIAIKKAYASLLKRNRPDEAPEAYQMLRQAYEWAVSEAEWLRRAAEEGGAPPEDEAGWMLARGATAEPVAEGEAALTFRPEPVPDPLPPAWSAPAGDASPVFEHESADALYARWAERLARCEVEDADACWQALQGELDALPLDEHGNASARFADFVLEHEAFPIALLIGLARHFRWGQDYRDTERLGPLRVTQLRERLAQDAPTLFRDARQVERATELLRLDWVLQRQGKRWGWLYAALAGPHLQRLLLDTDDRQRRALEISFLRWETLSTVIRHAGVLRLFFVLACVVPLAYVAAGADEPLLDWLALLALLGVAYWLAIWGVGRLVPALGATIGNALARVNLLNTWQSRVVAAVAIPIAAALTAHDAVVLPALRGVFPDPVLGVGAVLLCVGALLVPPESDEERRIVLPMLAVLTFALTGLVPERDAGWVVAMGVAGAWIALGGWVYHQYHDQVMAYYRSPWAVLRPRAWWGWVLLAVAFKFVVAALVFVLTLALPVTLRVLARYLSVQTAWLAIGLGVGAAITVMPEGARAEALALALFVVGAAAALTGLQALAERSAQRVFRGVPDTFFGDDD
jgi:hypothetical protein